VSRTTWTQDIAHAAGVVRLDPDLVEALVIVESAGNPYAWNPEPRYRYLVDCRTGEPFRQVSPDELASRIPPPDFPTLAGDRDQEWLGQGASWGLMQIMGALAREVGFRGAYLTELTRVDLNLRLGCGHLANLFRWANGNEEKAIAAYNAGRGGWASDAGSRYRNKVFNKRTELARSR
jgi:soluble lytic murein transglycosylase-like protein